MSSPTVATAIVLATVGRAPAGGGGIPTAAALVLGAIVAVAGVAVGAIVMRARLRRSARLLAREVDRLAEGEHGSNAERSWPRMPSELLGIAAAIRRATRATAARSHVVSTRVRELESILQSTTSGFIALDPQQRIVDLNASAARLLAIDRPSARGRLLQEVTRHPELNHFLADAMQRPSASEGECRLEGPEAVTVLATTEPLRDAAGRPVGMLLSLQDVTRLRRLERLRRDFVANVSHELRTPITSIKGYAETLLQVGPENRERTHRFVDIIHANAQRLSALVEDLLTLASLEEQEPRGIAVLEGAEPRPMKMDAVPARSIASEVVAQLGPTAEARGIRIITRCARQLHVWANRVLAEQALANLVSNAIRHSPAEGTVEIDVRGRAGSVTFSVRDSGPGIPAKHLPRIFERFYRVDSARTRADGGTGLGLAIVKHIAQAHGGNVEVESVVGEGSTFRLSLPEAELVAPASEDAAAEQVVHS